MMAIALAALAFLLTGEFQVAAVVLLALKCCQKIYAELCRRSKAQLPEEVSTSKKKEIKKVTEEIEMRLKAFQVRSEAAEELPPNVRVFTNEKPRGDDRWYPIQPGGWLIRKHGKHRQRCFHPLHRSCPVDSIRFEPVRFTVIFYEGGGRSKKKVIKDDWTGTPTVMNYGEWKGYTVFKLKDQPEVAPTQLDPEEPARSHETSCASDHIACGREEESLTSGSVISGVRDQASALSTAFPGTGGYGARDPNQPRAQARGQVAASSGISLRPQPQAVQQQPGELEEVMRGLQLLGRQYPGSGGEQHSPEVPRFGQVQRSAQLQGAAPLPGDVQLRGAGQDLCSGQVQGAERALQAATLAEDPISDYDDSFELITDDAPQPRPALRAFKFCGGGRCSATTSSTASV